MNPNPDPAKHKEVLVWNAEDCFYEYFVIGNRIWSIQRTISELFGFFNQRGETVMACEHLILVKRKS